MAERVKVERRFIDSVASDEELDFAAPIGVARDTDLRAITRVLHVGQWDAVLFRNVHLMSATAIPSNSQRFGLFLAVPESSNVC